MTLEERIDVLRGQASRLEALAGVVPDPDMRAAILRDVVTIKSMIDNGELARARNYPERSRKQSRR